MTLQRFAIELVQFGQALLMLFRLGDEIVAMVFEQADPAFG